MDKNQSNELKTAESSPGKLLSKLPVKEFNIKSKENQSYNLKIYQGEKTLIFHIKEIGDIGDTLYKSESTLEEFCKLNRIFRQYISIEELFVLFIQNYKDSEINITKKENQIKLAFSIEFMGKKEEISFILNPQQSKIENVVMNLCDKVKEIDKLNEVIEEQKETIKNLQKENEEFKNKINEKINKILKTEIEKIKSENENKINELKKNLNDLNNEINIIKRNNDSLYKDINFNPDDYNNGKKILDSNIIRYSELSLIDDGIKYKFKKKIAKYELLFRASRDGFAASNFHSKCDGKSYTVTFVETSIGRRFGGFTDQSWDQSSSYKTGSNGFIFSLDSKEIYYNKNSSNNIYCNSGYGPTFGGGHDFYLCNNCNNDYSSYNNSDHSYQTNGKKCAMAGTYNFFVKDYEVYQISLE